MTFDQGPDEGAYNLHQHENIEFWVLRPPPMVESSDSDKEETIGM